MRLSALILVALVSGTLGAEFTGPTLTITSQFQDAWDLAQSIQGDGIEFTQAVLWCDQPDQAGLFEDGSYSIDMDAGVVLSSSYAVNAMGRNDNKYLKPDGLGGWGYDPLDQILVPKNMYTRDACVLHLEFKCEDPSKFEFRYVFGSDDYPSTGFEDQEDLMAAFLNGRTPFHNIAKVAGNYVSINTVHNGNDLLNDNQYGAFATEMNGFTQVLTARANATTGTNRLYIAVADGGKRDSDTNGAWVFLEANSMKCPGRRTSTPAPTQPGRFTSPGKCANRILAYKRQNRIRCSRVSWVRVNQLMQKLCALPAERVARVRQRRQVRRYVREFCRNY